jgi:hypothetical protein
MQPTAQAVGRLMKWNEQALEGRKKVADERGSDPVVAQKARTFRMTNRNQHPARTLRDFHFCASDIMICNAGGVRACPLSCPEQSFRLVTHTAQKQISSLQSA